MRSKKHVNLIWKHTSKDYQGMLDGKKAIMYLDKGVTTLGTIEGLSDEQFTYYLGRALKKEKK